MEIEVYGFRAKVTRNGKHYVATVKELNANTQGSTLKEIKANLKEVVSMVCEYALKHESEYSKGILNKIKTNVVQNLA